jgi:hypothetical protein
VAVLVREFELYHGVAVAKIARFHADRPLRVLEMRPEESWSALALEDETSAFVVKHRSRPRKLRRKGGGKSWRFAFSQDQLARLRRLRRGRRLCLALVCGGGGQKAGHLEIVFLLPEEWRRLLDVNSFLPQWLSVQSLPRKELWISRGRTRVKIPRERLDRRDPDLDA